MFSMISFKANGERLSVATERPAFYGLTVHGTVIEYFTSVQALKLAVVQIERAREQYFVEIEVTFEFELAA